MLQVDRLERAVKTAEEARQTAQREAEVAASAAGKEATRCGRNILNVGDPTLKQGQVVMISPRAERGGRIQIVRVGRRGNCEISPHPKGDTWRKLMREYFSSFRCGRLREKADSAQSEAVEWQRKASAGESRCGFTFWDATDVYVCSIYFPKFWDVLPQVLGCQAPRAVKTPGPKGHLSRSLCGSVKQLP